MVSNVVVAIPSRYSASRLPGKPLRLLAGEPLIVHVVRRALEAQPCEVWVATDDARIGDILSTSGARVAMTSGEHASGTDRLAECADIAGWADDTIVVNLQGDEPFAPASGIRAVTEALTNSRAEMATLAEPIFDTAILFDPNTVKVVRTTTGEALYFSRAPIPWHRDDFARGEQTLSLAGEWLRHIGIYAYRAGFLRRFTKMPPSRLERIESLEQLRVLEAGLPISVALSPEPFPPGVDTEKDLAHAEIYLQERIR
ncbi:MAG: 3-deoxy-manno-octulosonate cytidylyltransferase [Xanthomonadaceae bacterium]|nr:3-deoxy-manno-octulosonate cytidylyltransferase [Xanthomonadaceae bacterium]